MKRSEQINELAAAMAKAQAEIGTAHKDRANDFFRSKYADLASVWDACRAPLSKYGLSIIQSPSAEGVNVTVVTVLLHTSGQWIESTLSVVAALPPSKDKSGKPIDPPPTAPTPQSVGSAITYARRYALQSMIGVAPDDDDGNAASGKTNGHADDRQSAPANGKPVEAPPKREMSQAFKDFAAGIKGLMEANGEETTSEQRRALVERVCLARGMAVDDLWTCDSDQFAALLMAAEDLLTPEGATV